MIKQEDIHLVQRLKQGDEEAFTELVDKYKGKAFSIAYNFVNNIEDARELSQEAFVKVYNSIDKFQEGSTFYTWFYRVLVNLCLDFKKKKRLKTISFSQFKHNQSDDGSDPMERIKDEQAQSPSEKLLIKEQNERIGQAVKSLPEKQRIVFILRNYENMPLKEIALYIKSREGTVKSHLARAVKKLQELLTEMQSNEVIDNGGQENG